MASYSRPSANFYSSYSLRLTMHSAPPVTYPLGRSHFQGFVLLGFWLAGVALLVLWWGAAQSVDWRLWAMLALILVAGFSAGLGWKNVPVGQLRWDGQEWCWESRDYQLGMPARDIAVALDFQRFLLLRLENHDYATLWLWASRSAMPERWLDLRRAVHAQRRPIAGAMPADTPASSAVVGDFSANPPRRAGS